MNLPNPTKLAEDIARPIAASSSVVASSNRLSEMSSMRIDELIRVLATAPEGLSQLEAERRLATGGANEAGRPYRSMLAAVLAPLISPLVLILLLSAGVSAFLGDLVGAEIIALMVLLSSALNFILGFRSQRAADRLRQEVAPTATVRRDGEWRDLPRREIVPGDVIRLSAGDHVPADARLLDGRDLHVQQAALTGESSPVEKEPVESLVANDHGADARQTVFLGTSVVAGTGIAVVFATGRTTQYGDIAERLSSRPPPTDFERGIAAFSHLIMQAVVFLVLFAMMASVALGRPAFESLLFAVALAVGLTPEFMPMIMTVTLARGAMRMAKRHVIVKHLAAIEAFGAMDILLSDKTGTLTTGEMSLDGYVDAYGSASERPVSLGYINARFETGIRSPLDSAILAHRSDDLDAFRKVDEIPFDFERRCLSVVVQHESRLILIVKGAPESLIRRCSLVEIAGQTLPLDASDVARAATTYEAMSERGLRVLAVAYRDVQAQSRYSAEDEKDLILAGFLSFVDPPAVDALETLGLLARDGITVKILTGDNERVAQHICDQIGLKTGRIVLGNELDGLSEAALAALAMRTVVFARVAPAQKQRIVIALKSVGSVVGYLGDGINDAPSLHSADVGISVVNAVDVAKDAADILLSERDLGVLHEGVIEGRKAFANVLKYLLMGTSSNFGNMFSMAAGVLFLPFLPMLPTQILLNNFLYDLAQVTIPTDNVDDALVARPQRWNMRLVRNFMLLIGPISSLYDFLTFYILLKWLHASESLFHTGWFVESLATQTLVLFVIRTFGNPLRSRPSVPLTATTVAVVAIALILPFTAWGEMLGFTALPWAFFVFLGIAAPTYLLIVEFAKRRLSTQFAYCATTPRHA